MMQRPEPLTRQRRQQQSRQHMSAHPNSEILLLALDSCKARAPVLPSGCSVIALLFMPQSILIEGTESVLFEGTFPLRRVLPFFLSLSDKGASGVGHFVT
jgi:hypothetical protein